MTIDRQLTDDEDRFVVKRTAHWIDEGLAIPDAQVRALQELDEKIRTEVEDQVLEEAASIRRARMRRGTP